MNCVIRVDIICLVSVPLMVCYLALPSVPTAQCHTTPYYKNYNETEEPVSESDNGTLTVLLGKTVSHSWLPVLSHQKDSDQMQQHICNTLQTTHQRQQ